jgi:hypothetical protein
MDGTCRTQEKCIHNRIQQCEGRATVEVCGMDEGKTANSLLKELSTA